MKRLVAAVALALMATSAQATWVTCDGLSQDAYVTPNIGCAQSTLPNAITNDPESLPLKILSDGPVFSHDDWNWLKKNDPPVPGVWDFGAIYSDMMLVFKYGNNPVTAYLVDVQSGTWTNTFAQTFGNGSGVSHITYYVRGTPTTVSEPTSLALMFAGLLGLAVTRRKTA